MSRPRKSAGRAGSRWRRIRLEVLERDARVCWICNTPGADTVDHLVPLSKGGDPYDKGNLRAAHNLCNVRRGTGRRPPSSAAMVRTSRHW